MVFLRLLATTISAGLLFACQPPPPVEGAWSGSVTQVETGSVGGITVCQQESCRLVAAGDVVPPGSALQTDTHTIASLTLADGSMLLLDRDTTLSLDAQRPRSAQLVQGEVVADIQEIESSRAFFTLPSGEVEVLGTRLALVANDMVSEVAVVRGSVRLGLASGESLQVESGHAATIEPDGAAQLRPRTRWETLAAFSDDGDSTAMVGLGELRARLPGQSDEAAEDLSMTRHAVTVRISGAVARTEVEEVFTNHSEDELEGIFRFPLPPDAQIEGLTLDVDGVPMEGAFVERDRGAAIWRGVLANAAPQRKTDDEIIWVPGPWRDPALLEWERGGRFELRIFPIPAHGSRRITLSYTQVVPDSGGIRRYTYPLAHDAAGSTAVGDFSVDVKVVGHDAERGVWHRGYDLVPEPESADHYRYSAQGFSPSGDLSVAYTLPEATQDAVAWTWSGSLSNTEHTDIPDLSDPSGFVALSIRPQLQAVAGARPDQSAVVVVDTSRSMVGERFTQARTLARAIITEMDPRDRVRVLACDETCAAFSSEPIAPGARSARSVDAFLRAQQPDGGSDLANAVRAAVQTAAGDPGVLRVLMLSDGTPTVGPARPATLAAAVADALPERAAVVAVALGADADTTALSAVARGGSGVVVPHVAGLRAEAHALSVLSASYGAILSEPTLTLPEGLHAQTPASLGPILAGEELIVLARLDAGRELVTGDAVLRGTVRGQPFEARYPIKIVESRWAGNAFVPRLYAASRIADLDLGGQAEDIPTIVAWSKAMRVASRHTSLLVLESEAMFDAFELDRTALAPVFTGEVAGLSESAAPATGALSVLSEREMLDDAVGGFAAATGQLSASRSSARSSSSSMTSSGIGSRGQMDSSASAARRSQPPAPLSPVTPELDAMLQGVAGAEASMPVVSTTRAPRRQVMIPMRRVWDRNAKILSERPDAREVTAQIRQARSSLAVEPDSRDRTVTLYRLLAATGQLTEARALLEEWSARDAMDGEALLTRSDLAGREGDRDRALRILGGVADARPDEDWLHERLAETFTRLGRVEQACAHRIALAELRIEDAQVQGRAVRCAREEGWVGLAEALIAGVPESVRDDAEQVALSPISLEPARGDLVVTGTWSGSVDLDMALIDREGRRLSWYSSTGRRGRAHSDSGGDAVGEQAFFSGLGTGTYALEVSRSDGGTEPVSGELTVDLPGASSQTLRFTTRAGRAEAGLIQVWFSSRLVEDTSIGRR